MEKAVLVPIRKRVVIVPYPFQGHLTPMLQLASVLESNGFPITITHTEFNSPNPSDHPRFAFLSLPDGLAGHNTSFNYILNVMGVMNANCEGPFEELMSKMLQDEEKGCGQQVACVIYDAIMKFADDVGSRLKVPTILFRPTMAANLHSYTIFVQLLAQNLIPIPESEMDFPIPNVHPLRFKDLPLSPAQQLPKQLLDFIHNYIHIGSSSAVIWNTIESLDHWSLHQLQHHWPVPFFPIGPLHKIAKPSQTNLLEEDTSCLPWLHKQSPNSVLFISLGSIAVVQKEELLEMALGISRSGHPFLWAMRPTLLGDADPVDSLPEDFKKAVKERGCMVRWAPQKTVLAHPAVGGFLTHCGWNSSLEAICEGVPLICRPFFGDQRVNARYLTHVWRVGLELENTTARGYERGIRVVMGSEEGEMMRQRVAKLKQEVEFSSMDGGASHESLGRLVGFISSLTRTRRD